MARTVTGTYYLRPNSDISIGHSASTSPAWKSVADDEGSTWIYSTSTDYSWSTFGMGLYSGVVPDLDYTISSVVLHVNHQASNASIARYGYFRYSWYMNDVEYASDLVERKNDDRVDYTQTFSNLDISVSANTVPTTTIKGGTKRGGWISFQNRISQMYLEVKWQYELPQIILNFIDNTSDRRVDFWQNVYLETIEGGTELRNLSSESEELDSSLLVGRAEYTALPTNTSNTFRCIMTDPTMACVFGYFDIPDDLSEIPSTEYMINWACDGPSGTSYNFGQVSNIESFFCMIIDAKIYKGNKQMLPITRPIYIGNERVSSVLCNVEFLYGFYGYKLASDGHHLIADSANYPPDEVIIEE